MNGAGNYQENLSKQQVSTTATEPKEYIEGERECRRRVHLQDDANKTDWIDNKIQTNSRNNKRLSC